ncbi:MAG: hypothetical protein NTZ92_05845 [Candidatus Omnitrophica bacterium]|nr:hypothetical protein [Candidatus Omnitrophota bacterium]
MFKKNRTNNRAQSILDFILIFGILLTFIVGLTRIWVWFNANYAKRNVDYQNTRLAAGQANDSHQTALSYSDSVLTIDDDWVFKGKASGRVGTPPQAVYSAIDALGGSGNSGTAAVCSSAQSAATALRTEADGMDGEADNLDDFLSWAGSWALEWLFELIGVDIDGMEDARDSLWCNACYLRAKAAEIETAACGSSSVTSSTVAQCCARSFCSGNSACSSGS